MVSALRKVEARIGAQMVLATTLRGGCFYPSDGKDCKWNTHGWGKVSTPYGQHILGLAFATKGIAWKGSDRSSV